MRHLLKARSLSRTALLLFAGLATHCAPIGARAESSCFQTAAKPKPTVSVEKSDYYVKITWPAFTGCPAFGGQYVVYRSTSSTFSWNKIWGLAATFDTSFFDYYAKPGTTYWYWIGVVDDKGKTWVDFDKGTRAQVPLPKPKPRIPASRPRARD